MFNAVLQANTPNGGKRTNVAAGPKGDVLVSQYGLPYARWVAEGKGFRVVEATATAGVAALPTTTAGLTLQNGEAETGKWYVVHSIGATFEASAAAVETAYIAHCVGMNRVAAGTRDLAATSIKPLLGGAGPYQGLAIVDLGATVIDDLWSPATSAVSNAVASNSEFAVVKELDGLVVLMPGAQYSIEICATTTGVTGRLMVRWFEVDRDELVG